LTNDEISIVGAAFSRDYAMIARKRLFFAAESRSHEKLMLFDDIPPPNLSKFYMSAAAGLKSLQSDHQETVAFWRSFI